jgi:pimeloyl-ACP methyl ester carboxylesterase
MLLRRQHAILLIAAFVAAAALPLHTISAQTALMAAQDTASLLGGERAQGAVIWSHGRSLQKECAEAPTPEYVLSFSAAGWDTFRLNRPRFADTLPASGAALAEAAEMLKQRGYRRVILAGQSFGAFISLIAAGRSDAVDGVIGTAPAAYGSAESNPSGFAQNSTGLYELLGAVRHARVALFFFAGDVFDPGGRGAVADQVLAARRLTHIVVDKPAGLSTHWAAAGSAFAAQYGACLVAFAAGNSPADTFSCRAQTAPARIGAIRESPSAAPYRVASLAYGTSTSVVNLKIGGREDVGRAWGGR